MVHIANFRGKMNQYPPELDSDLAVVML